MIRARDERGAVLMIVAICLLVLLGMLVLTFDLGRGVAIKRNMVNGADAAALAAARECGLANGEAAALEAATDLLADNNGAATVVSFEITPSPAQCSGAPNPNPDEDNEVTVTASVPQEYFFAQIFGFTGGAVVASATATWEPAVVNPAPLKLEALKVDECLRAGAGSSCYFKFEPNQGQWGWLNFPEGWPVKGEANPPTDCPATGGTRDLVSYIRTMGLSEESSFLPSLWNVPVWVCAFNGDIDEGQQEIQHWIDTVGTTEPRPIVSFPVVAPPPPGPCPAEGCWQWYTGSRASYPVIRLEGFYFEDLFQGQEIRGDAELQEACGFDGPTAWGSVFCIELKVVDLGTDPPGGAVRVRLVD